jgi:hypothetical protein
MAVRPCTFVAACLCFLILLPVLGSTDCRCGQYFAAATAAAQGVHDQASPELPGDKLAVGSTIGFRNGNDYPVRDVTLGCDFFDEWGNPIGTKMTTIRRVVSPGRTKISGIYFTLIFANRLRSNALAGACRIISAKRVREYPTPTS